VALPPIVKALLSVGGVTAFFAIVGELTKPREPPQKSFQPPRQEKPKVREGVIQAWLAGQPLATRLTLAERREVLRRIGLIDEARGIPQRPLGRAHREFISFCLRNEKGGREGMRECNEKWLALKEELAGQLGVQPQKELQDVADVDRALAEGILEEVRGRPGADVERIDLILSDLRGARRKALPR